ncbi:MAG TPA: GGDEF domain-containing protein [Syntrophorhabdaceae bacterium]|nr:GGDEF domain-containing protein [Syntrophorhabdaceae bacterium]HOT42305.1 GGDEF domain-containing protein [Syntrophorhabdaceae bacterium]HPC67425.1 GGDEF domain-containing protein [Syntrophorhabdaceae bacterium]HQE80142.1 GGDEF domain-containing protein [Syntrophorhabdaceae bacterium]HQH43836.1 GGDEF domain-containing protein [Syntrophorhabdaceae bacterium]
MQKIVLITEDAHVKEKTEKVLAHSFELICLTDIKSIFSFLYDSIPVVVIVDIQNCDDYTFDAINQIKSDPIFGSISFIALIFDNDNLPESERVFIDDYLKIKDIESDLAFRIRLSIHRSKRLNEINPLTRLPGNISIDREIHNRLLNREEFAIAYADLDNFKPFNDRYGFGRGDEVIKATGRLILNIVKNKQPSGSFVGHIGGDDFVYMMNYDSIEDASKEIINAFEIIIPTFYDIEDRERGFIESTDRQGNKRLFPLMTISIGITHNRYIQFTHYGEIKETASKMKTYAKTFKGSCFKIDERQIRN